MRRRATLQALGAVFAIGPIAAFSQQQKVWRIGAVWAFPAPNPSEQAFLAGMKERGYEAGRHFVMVSRYAAGDPARFPALVDDVLGSKPDVLLGTSTLIAIEMKKRTGTIPIVLGTPGDPVGSGLAHSLARPGGNVTGMSLQLHELSAKHIELLAEMLPRLRRLAVLSDASNEPSITTQYERIARTTSAAKGMSLSVHRVERGEDTRRAFRDLEAQPADALIINPSPRFNVLRREIAANAAAIRLPAVGFTEEWAQDGALAGFGPSFAEAYRRSAYYVERLFKGARPADLPIEQPTKFTLALNARTARELGIKLPDTLLVRADQVVGMKP